MNPPPNAVLDSTGLTKQLEECYTHAIRSTADYALDFHGGQRKQFQEHLLALAERVGEHSPEDLRSVQASFRGELRDYRDKAQTFMEHLKSDLEGATEAMKTFATSFVNNGTDAENKVRGQINRLEQAVEGNDLGQLRECVLTATQEIARSYDELNKLNQLVIAELQHEIRLLHKEMESERRAAWSDPDSGAWVKRKLDERVDDLLKTSEPFCVLILVATNLRRLETQCSKTVVQGALTAMVKRCYGVLGDDVVVSRLGHDMFAALVELEPSSAYVIAEEMGDRLSSRYSVQENGVAQNITLRVQSSVVDRSPDISPEEFRRRLNQMVGNEKFEMAQTGQHV